MNLFHFSSEPDIKVFVPRVKANRTDMPPVVWAIDQEHAFTFYFPRNCPRIVYTRSGGINREDEARFFGLSCADKIITVETQWYKAIKESTIYRYTLPSASFQLFDKTAGYYISEQTVTPVVMKPMRDLIGKLADLNIEIRLTPNLHPLKEAILNSTLDDFGIHRFHLAKPFEQGRPIADNKGNV
ncbi:DUF6886 family protein [Paenibacillus sp. FJAT-26967]|uniref:DUF6886 family protein n=1 Tax=Paenibacillus sp. FJAT-26967 TaxID=1729690 RepID=UPI000837BDD8|nr:DUF6886 family protein [Paenibacillus sp. FJAT-26967]